MTTIIKMTGYPLAATINNGQQYPTMLNHCLSLIFCYTMTIAIIANDGLIVDVHGSLTFCSVCFFFSFSDDIVQ